MVAGRQPGATLRRGCTLPPMTEQEMMMQARALSLASLETVNGPDRVEGVYYKLLFFLTSPVIPSFLSHQGSA